MSPYNRRAKRTALLAVDEPLALRQGVAKVLMAPSLVSFRNPHGGADGDLHER